MKFKPVHDRVVITQNKAETVTTSGIVITDGAVEKPSEGVVIAHGEGVKTRLGVLVPLEVSVGDRVLFYKGAGQHIKIEGEEVVVLKQEEIYAIIED